MNGPFKRGDKVRYVNRMFGEHWDLVLGNVYTVTETRGDLLGVEEVEDGKVHFDWRRFEPVEGTNDEGRFLVVAGASILASYTSRKAAEDDAAERALRSPKITYDVFKAVKAFQANVSVTGTDL